jgi:ribosome biogenesis protein MAK21
MESRIRVRVFFNFVLPLTLILFQGFIKRLLQLCLFNDIPFICGILLLISELVKRHPNGARLLLFSQKPSFSAKKSTDDDDDEEEHFHDVPNEDDQPLQTVPEISSWDHKNLNKINENRMDHYDIYKRNPLYCGSEYTCLHELIFLKNHSHPTVALFAQNLLDV